MNQKFFQMSKLAALVASCCIPAVSMAYTGVENHYGKKIVIENLESATPYQTIDNDTTATLNWTFENNHAFFTVYAYDDSKTNNLGKMLCTELPQPYKHVNNHKLLVASDGTCTDQGPYTPGPNPPPPPTENHDPIIQNLATPIEMEINTAYSANGTVQNPDADAGDTLSVTIEQSTNSTNWLHVSKKKEGNHYAITANGTPSQPGYYDYTVTAKNVKDGKVIGETDKTVAITAQNPDVPPSDDGEVIPRTVSAWIYDAANNNTVPGQFTQNINTWNATAIDHGTPENQITELHTYGSDMEMYNNDTYLESYYASQTRYKTNSSQPINEMVGPAGAAFYLKKVGDALVATPIIDGRTDVGYLKGFNNLSLKNAQGYADLLAQQVCVDHKIRGVQVDIEPLTFTESAAQVEFYLRLTDDFNGNNVAACHYLSAPGKLPDYVSVFTFANRIAAGATGKYATQVKDLLKRPNFLVIDSLYDLPSDGAAKPDFTSLGKYKTEVNKEVQAVVSAAQKYHFNYKFGIPASCSFHECARELGNGTTQQQFVQEAMTALGQHNVCGVTYNGRNLFKGIAIWAFVVDNPIWEGEQYHILPPSNEVVNYMAKLNDQQVVGCNLNSTWEGK